ncbi:MAG: O-linked GlcNAc transferase [Bacteroidota bacterium]
MQTLERYLMDAEKAFQEQEFLQGKEFLEYALAEEPTYGKAHSHMGWLYLYHLNDYEKAESHLRLALKYSAKYSAIYQHMATLLFDARRLDEHESLLEAAMQVTGVPPSFIFNDFGRNREVQGRYKEAIKLYKLGIQNSLDSHEISVIRDNIQRCKQKRWKFLFG